MTESLLWILVFLVYYRIFRGRRNFPGPWRIPVIGNLHQVAACGTKEPSLAFHKIAEKYGPIISLQLGWMETIHLSAYEDIVEVLGKDECADRNFPEMIHDRSWSLPLGIIFSNGASWKAVRRFTIRTLRDFGFGKRMTMESSMGGELETFLRKTRETLKDSGGRFQVDLLFNRSLMNVMWTMVAGRRYSQDDPRMTRLLQVTSKALKSGNFGTDPGYMFPVLLKVLPSLTYYAPLHEFFEETQVFFKEIVGEQRKRDYAGDPECFIDHFLKAIDAEKDGGAFTEKQLLTVLLDLFLTASETLGGGLSYAVLFMALNPRVQEKVHEEIQRVVLPSTDVLFPHKDEMIYTQASLRLGNIVPIIPTRQVNKSFEYKGFHFEKGMTVTANLHSVFQDSTYFEEPQEFRPERFIDPHGRLHRHERMSMAFGVGKRFCMGEPLAQSALFMFFTTFMRHFRVSCVPGEPLPSPEAVPSFTRSPLPFDVILQDKLDP